jgi:ferric-dicitrate binding protein FerR (iron transport regulator)
VEENKDFKDDTFLSRWLQGQLSEEEKTAFESSEAFREYQQIIQTADDLKTPSYDLDKAYGQLKNKRSVVKSLKKKRSWPAYAAVAASILLIAAAFWYFRPVPDEQFLTQIGEQESILLPDNSHINLNAASRLSFNPKSWKRKKVVQLNGEAFFSVTEGQQFVVQTSNGQVSVLGTEFNVWNRGPQMEVSCYRGVVEVTRDGQSLTLNKGVSAQWQNNQWRTDTLQVIPSTASWTEGTVSFKAAPLSRVLQELKHHYDIKVTLVGNAKRTYSGGFPTDDLETALTNISEPMGLSYQMLNPKEVIFRER